MDATAQYYLVTCIGIAICILAFGVAVWLVALGRAAIIKAERRG